MGGLRKLVERLEQEGVPENAIVEWRDWNVAEFLWSAADGISRANTEG